MTGLIGGSRIVAPPLPHLNVLIRQKVGGSSLSIAGEIPKRDIDIAQKDDLGIRMFGGWRLWLGGLCFEGMNNEQSETD
ncbi:hypothetical protein SAMN04490186_1538 [Pseudomonas grimontii]|uniref:Uncharacterized protein n=1 Tax=Pseudomonas grimontii TaxID=129847 RepID=A0ABY0TES6_9PSED|nr:hypothetical protein SAMN04490186_1538 [Pseudomonas grimontii]